MSHQDHQWHLDGQFDVDAANPNDTLALACQFDQQPGTLQPWSCQGDLDQLPLRLLRQGVKLAVAIGKKSQFGHADDLVNIKATSMSGRKTLEDRKGKAEGIAHHFQNGLLDSFAAAQARFEKQTEQLEMANDWLLGSLQGEINGDLHLKGSTEQPAHVDLAADLHFWLPGNGGQVNHDLSAGGKPLRLRMEGPLEKEGNGISKFGFDGLPLKLLALVNPQLSLKWSCMGQFSCSDEEKKSPDLFQVLQKFPLQGQLRGGVVAENLLGAKRKVVTGLRLQDGHLNRRSISLSNRKCTKKHQKDQKDKETCEKAGIALQQAPGSLALQELSKAKSGKGGLFSEVPEDIGILNWKDNIMKVDVQVDVQTASGEKQNLLRLLGHILRRELPEQSNDEVDKKYKNTLYLAFTLQNEVFPLLFASSADGLAFLEGLSGGTLVWKRGDASLIGILDGTMKKPTITGYGRVTEFLGCVADIPITFSGVLKLKKKSDKTKTLLSFDSGEDDSKPLEIAIFNYKESQTNQSSQHSSSDNLKDLLETFPDKCKLRAEGEIKAKGKIKIKHDGTLSLFQEEGQKIEEQKSIVQVELEDIQLDRLDLGPLKADLLAKGKLDIKGSIIPPKIEIGNHLQIKQGTIYPEPDFNSEEAKFNQKGDEKFIQDLEWISLNNLKVEFSDLEFLYPPYVNFTFANKGNFQVKGPIGSELKADGQVNLSKGQISYLGSSLNLDQNAKNAVRFSLNDEGIIFPHLDISMWSSVTGIAKNQYFSNNIANNILSNSGNFNKGRIFGIVQGRLKKQHWDKLELIQKRLATSELAKICDPTSSEENCLEARWDKYLFDDFFDDILKIENNLGLPKDELASLIGIDVFGRAIGRRITNILLPSANKAHQGAPTQISRQSLADGRRAVDSLNPLTSSHSQTNLLKMINNALRQKTSVSLLPTLAPSSKDANSTGIPSENSVDMELLLNINSRLNLSLISHLKNYGGLETSYVLDFHLSPVMTTKLDIDDDGNWKGSLGFGYRF